MPPRIKVLIVIGTRPEAIKMAPLIKRLSNRPEFILKVCSTGQHRELIQQVFTLFSIRPAFDLQLMEYNQPLSKLTGRVLAGVEELIRQQRPDRILVHGDTTTTMASALAAFYAKVPLGHVEAGLRSHDLHAPWPEELNRKLADLIAERLYAPTGSARDNLLREGVSASKVIVTGNTVIDALLDVVNGPLQDAKLKAELDQQMHISRGPKKLVLVTSHRRESYGRGFASVAQAIATLARRSDVEVVFPIHHNPNVRSAFKDLENSENVRLVEPLSYLQFVYLLSICHFVLTDSGGIQEEAPSLGKPVLVMREVTERPEAIAAGTAILVGTDAATIIRESCRLLDHEADYAKMAQQHNPYGDGHACERIIASLASEW